MDIETAFRHYIAALADEEAAKAAEIYANFSIDPEFVNLTKVFDVLWQHFLDEKVTIDFDIMGE